MELREAVTGLISNLPDVSMNIKELTSETGKTFSHFIINRRGEVLMFTAPYPSVDEKYNENFLKKVEREL